MPAPIPAFAPVLRPLAGAAATGVLDKVVDGRSEDVVAIVLTLEGDVDIVAESLADGLVGAAFMKN